MSGATTHERSEARSNAIDYINISTSPTKFNCREIWIDCDLIIAFKADINFISKEELIYEVISHEFYHGIQWSHTSAKLAAQVKMDNNVSCLISSISNLTIYFKKGRQLFVKAI